MIHFTRMQRKPAPIGHVTLTSHGDMFRRHHNQVTHSLLLILNDERKDQAHVSIDMGYYKQPLFIGVKRSKLSIFSDETCIQPDQNQDNIVVIIVTQFELHNRPYILIFRLVECWIQVSVINNLLVITQHRVLMISLSLASKAAVICIKYM